MHAEHKAAFVIAQSVEAFGLMAAMHAENMFHITQGGAPVYGASAFRQIAEDRGLHHNALITFFQD